jgi:hypothetical protein
MTEEWWRQYKDNKQKSENKIFTDIESELKRRFKSEKKPEEMYYDNPQSPMFHNYIFKPCF